MSTTPGSASTHQECWIISRATSSRSSRYTEHGAGPFTVVIMDLRKEGGSREQGNASVAPPRLLVVRCCALLCLSECPVGVVKTFLKHVKKNTCGVRACPLWRCTGSMHVQLCDMLHGDRCDWSVLGVQNPHTPFEISLCGVAVYGVVRLKHPQGMFILRTE